MYRLILALAFGFFASAQCFAQASLVGAYRLVENDLKLDGQTIQPMGKSQHGYLVITPKILMQFFTADERKRGTSSEAKAALLDSLAAWAGPYRVEGNKILIDVDTGWTEVWKGTQQVRTYEFTGNRLTMIVAPQPSATQPGKTLTARTVGEDRLAQF
jgi:hypothetical protein